MTATGVIWHEVENGSYEADLPLWRELAEEAGGEGGGRILDLGAGTGRVALDLAARGHEVVALDLDPDLLQEISSRTDLVETVEADARAFDLGEERFALAIAPMQLVQIIGGPAARAAMLERVHGHLEPGGVFAAALADPYEAGGLGPARCRGGPGARASGWDPPLPDMLERDGWVYSSHPLSVTEAGGRVVVERRRQAVAPDGSLESELVELALELVTIDAFEAEAGAAGLAPIGRRQVPETGDHIGSTVVTCRR